MSDHVEIGWARPGHLAAMTRIASRRLSGEHGHVAMRLRLDLQFQHGLIAFDAGAPVGFVTFFLADGHAHVGWLVVPEAPRGPSLCTVLLERLCQELGRLGITNVHAQPAFGSGDHGLPSLSA